MPVFSLNSDLVFPHPELAREDGLLAVGGDLSVDRLLLAYENGIFPWFNQEDPPLWWSPPERAVLFPDELKVSKSLKQEMRKGGYEIKFNSDFKSIIKNCQKVRLDEEGTWITKNIIESYTQLHQLGIAHSVETYFENQLVGGLYGLTMGKVFCGESMFSFRSNASKIALFHLVQKLQQNDFQIIDCQIMNPHLKSLGAREIPRNEFLSILKDSSSSGQSPENWIKK